jgi:hypothetical protein
MRSWWKELDRILRGEATRLPALKRGTIELPVGGLSVLLIVLAMIHGACMGSFSVFRGANQSHLQVLASTLKVPALFILTLLVTFPSLYVFNALVGSRLMIEAVLRLLIAALAVTVAVLASLGPIVAFFSASTTSYPFMVLLNVVVFVIAGLMGMAFLLQTLHRLSLFGSEAAQAEPPDDSAAHPAVGVLDSPDDRVLSRHVKVVFRCWILLFGLVGAQMGWVLRPFIGKPGMPFTWFRPRESNVFQGIMDALARLFS